MLKKIVQELMHAHQMFSGLIKEILIADYALDANSGMQHIVNLFLAEQIISTNALHHGIQAIHYVKDQGLARTATVLAHVEGRTGMSLKEMFR